MYDCRPADAQIDTGICGTLTDYSIDFQFHAANFVPFHHFRIIPLVRVFLCHCVGSVAVIAVTSGFDTNEANRSFSIVLTYKPRLHVAVNNRGFARERNCDNSYSMTRAKKLR